MNLFDLTQQQKHILSLGDEMDAQTVQDTLEGLDIDSKFASYSAIIKTLNADSDALADAIKTLQQKKKFTENKVTRLKDMALFSMRELNMTKAGNAVHSLTLRAGSKQSKVVHDEDAKFPEVFVSMVEKLDNAGLKKALQLGIKIKGFHLEDGEASILIK
jgi:hypothetical protein